MAMTPYEPENAKFSNDAHLAARTLIYPRLWRVPDDRISYEDVRIDADTSSERYQILDGEMGVDRLISITHPRHPAPIGFHVQERFRKPKYRERRDVTITAWNHASGLPSEFHKIRAGYFVYGYFDEENDRFLDAIAFNVDDLKLAVVRDQVEYDRWHYEKKNQSFLIFSFAELHQIGVVRYHQEQEDEAGRRLFVASGIVTEPTGSLIP